MRRRILVLACLIAFSAQLHGEIKPEQGYVTLPDGYRIFYQKIGDGPQKLIIPAGLYLFDDFKALAPGRTLVFYDMRNRGRSDFDRHSERLTLQQDVQDLEALRLHFGFEKFSTIGYSYLGLMVVLYAVEHPGRVDRIVQIGPVPMKFGTEYPADQKSDDYEQVVSAEGRAELKTLRDENRHLTHPDQYCQKEWDATGMHLVGDPAHFPRLASQCDKPNEWPTNLARHFAHHFVSVQNFDPPKEKIAALQTPVLTVHGTRDRNAAYGSGREWAATLPNARLLTIKGGAHAAWLHESQIVSEIDRFFSGEWPKRAEDL